MRPLFLSDSLSDTRNRNSRGASTVSPWEQSSIPPPEIWYATYWYLFLFARKLQVTLPNSLVIPILRCDATPSSHARGLCISVFVLLLLFYNSSKWLSAWDDTVVPVLRHCFHRLWELFDSIESLKFIRQNTHIFHDVWLYSHWLVRCFSLNCPASSIMKWGWASEFWTFWDYTGVQTLSRGRPVPVLMKFCLSFQKTNPETLVLEQIYARLFSSSCGTFGISIISFITQLPLSLPSCSSSHPSVLIYTSISHPSHLLFPLPSFPPLIPNPISSHLPFTFPLPLNPHSSPLPPT